MTNQELRLAIRRVLKDAGVNARRASISVRDAGYSTSVRIIIRDLTVDAAEVNRLADQFEEIRRCEHSGEILEGANTYVNVWYCDNAVKIAVEEKVKEAQNLWDEVHKTCKPGYGMTVARSKKHNSTATLMLGEHAARNQIVIFTDGDGCSNIKLGTHSAHCVYTFARALVLYELHGHF